MPTHTKLPIRSDYAVCEYTVICGLKNIIKQHCASDVHRTLPEIAKTTFIEVVSIAV